MSATPVTELRRALQIVREFGDWIHAREGHEGSMSFMSCVEPGCRQVRVKLESFYVKFSCFACGADMSVLKVDQHDPVCDRCLGDSSEMLKDARSASGG